jgi:cytochrome d ubiquinol oxidase subunit I
MAGLDTVPRDVAAVADRVLVVPDHGRIGLRDALLGAWSPPRAVRKRLYEWRWFHRFALIMGPSGFAR